MGTTWRIVLFACFLWEGVEGKRARRQEGSFNPASCLPAFLAARRRRAGAASRGAALVVQL